MDKITVGETIAHGPMNPMIFGLDHESIPEKTQRILSEDAVHLWGQGIYDAKAEKTNKVEVLARFQDDDGTIIPPSSFLPFIVKYNLTKEFDLLVFEKSLKHISNSHHDNDLKYSINFYKSTLMDPEYQGKVYGLMEHYRIQAGKIIIEILEDDTEKCSMSFNDTHPMRIIPISENMGISNKSGMTKSCQCTSLSHEVLNRSIRILRGCGLLFAVDDFPTGTNCIHNVEKMREIDYVKIDGMWLITMLNRFKGMEQKFIEIFHTILDSIQRKHPNIQFVVERIENEYLFNLFNQMGRIDYFQGYHFSRTGTLSSIEKGIEIDKTRRDDPNIIWIPYTNQSIN